MDNKSEIYILREEIKELKESVNFWLESSKWWKELYFNELERTKNEKMEI